MVNITHCGKHESKTPQKSELQKNYVFSTLFCIHWYGCITGICDTKRNYPSSVPSNDSLNPLGWDQLLILNVLYLLSLIFDNL